MVEDTVHVDDIYTIFETRRQEIEILLAQENDPKNRLALLVRENELIKLYKNIMLKWLNHQTST